MREGHKLIWPKQEINENFDCPKQTNQNLRVDKQSDPRRVLVSLGIVTEQLSLDKCHRATVTGQMSPNNCHWTNVTEQLSLDKCHRAIVTGQMSQSNYCHWTNVSEKLSPVDCQRASACARTKTELLSVSSTCWTYVCFRKRGRPNLSVRQGER